MKDSIKLTISLVLAAMFSIAYASTLTLLLLAGDIDGLVTLIAVGPFLFIPLMSVALRSR